MDLTPSILDLQDRKSITRANLFQRPARRLQVRLGHALKGLIASISSLVYLGNPTGRPNKADVREVEVGRWGLEYRNSVKRLRAR
jgi:hypothetical protein